MTKKSHHFLTLWPWPLTYDLEKLIKSGHYHYQCVYQILEQSIPCFLSYRVKTIAGGFDEKNITSPDPSDTGQCFWKIKILGRHMDHPRRVVGSPIPILGDPSLQMWRFGQNLNWVILQIVSPGRLEQHPPQKKGQFICIYKFNYLNNEYT